MSSFQQVFVSSIVATVLAAIILLTVGHPQTTQLAATSPQGSTGSTARQYSIFGVNLAAPGANATSSSIQNNTSNDIYVTAVKIACEGVGTSKTAYTGAGLAALTMSVGTTSTAAPAAVPTNLIGGSAYTIATGTVNFLLASSTNGNALANFTGIWPAGSYMTFFSNATNTAVCTVGVDGTSS